jgi:hypothetical protein
MMTHQDINGLVIEAIDELNLLVWYQQLIELGLEVAATNTPKNFDRLHLLLDVYRSNADCQLNTLQNLLDRLLNATTE